MPVPRANKKYCALLKNMYLETLSKEGIMIATNNKLTLISKSRHFQQMKKGTDTLDVLVLHSISPMQ